MQTHFRCVGHPSAICHVEGRGHSVNLVSAGNDPAVARVFVVT